MSIFKNVFTLKVWSYSCPNKLLVCAGWWKKDFQGSQRMFGTMVSKGTHSCSYYYVIICLFKWCAMPTNNWASIKVCQGNKNMIRTEWTGDIYHFYITEIYCLPSDCSFCDTWNYALNICTTTRVATLSNSREHQLHPRCYNWQTLEICRDRLFSCLQGAFDM